LEYVPKYPLKNKITYCQRDTTSLVTQVQYFYDEKKNLIKATYIDFKGEKSVGNYTYNEQGLLSSIYYYNLADSTKISKDLFNYNSDKKLISEFSGYKRENIYSTRGQLTSHINYGSNKTIEFNFEYDSLGRLTKVFKENKLHITRVYNNNQLTKEVEYGWNLAIRKVTTFEYNSEGQLVLKKENDKITERNIYNDTLLVEKWENYYGIDPGIIAPCSGNDISKYQYYIKAN
jgi:YD repeat-containing protein